MSDFQIKIPPFMAVTGRINNWLRNPRDFHPASCTVFHTEDSLFRGKDSISESIMFTIYGLAHGAGVAIDLSDLRPNGTTNDRGLTASGVTSFSKIYSMVNEVVRRGGVYKNGAITIYIDCASPDLEEFLNTTELSWAKRAVYITTESWEGLTDEDQKLLAHKVNNGEVWLAKKQYDKNGKRLYSNVCLEVLLPSRGTCMLSSVNLGMVDNLDDIPKMFQKSMAVLCRIHANTDVDRDGFYLSPDKDKQVGLGVIGLANLLARFNITYKEFVEALEYLVLDKKDLGILPFNNAYVLAKNLIEGHNKAAEVARQHKMERAFAIAPTASMSYRYTDLDGYTTTPEISPPLSTTVDRDSSTFGVTTHEYHPDCETASNVGWTTQWRLLNAWQTMMDNTGMGHAISANLWTTFVVTPEWISNEFLPSPLKTTYYRLQVDQQALDKSEAVTPESSEEKLRDIYYDPSLEPDGENIVCEIGGDKNYCSACGG